jgi:HlyD family secretion protein
MRKKMTTAVLTGFLVAAGGAWHHFHASSELPRVTLAAATRGEVVQSVVCTGSLGANTTVDVGSQVSGTISEIRADFNSIVHKGDVLARLDPSLFQARVKQAQSALDVATAAVEGGRVAVFDATVKLGQARALAAKQLIPQSDLDDAEVAMKDAEAQLHVDEGAVLEARGALEQAQVDLTHVVIASPIDGIVIDRKIDVGQTVAASMQTPSLFSVAADLTRLQLKADVDQSDIGHVRAGQRARFHVDAYPGQEFEGRVAQVWLQPTVELMSVSYTTVIEVDNAQLRLRPGMTATINIDVAQHDDVVRIPSLALRFRPNQVVLHALGEASLDHASERVPLLFTPGMTAQVWVGRGKWLEPGTVRIGLSDANYTEIVDGLAEGTSVAVAAALGPVAER